MSESKWFSDNESVKVVIGALIISGAIGYMATHLTGGPRIESEDHNGVWAPMPYGKSPTAGEYNVNCASPKDHDEADLCLQWRAAQATEKAADSAEAQKYWNWFQLVGILATVAASWAAVMAARAAQQSVTIAERTAKQQLRAYVFVDEILVENLEDPTKAFAKIMIKNGGQTPAYEFRHKTGRFIRLPDDDSDFPVTPTSTSGSVSVMNPDGITKIGVDLEYSSEVIDAIREGRAILFVFGRITYKDIFGKEQESCFRCTYGGANRDARGGMAFCAEGNGAT